jgi:hypothetical protein
MTKIVHIAKHAAKRIADTYVERDRPRLVVAWDWLQAEASGLSAPRYAAGDTFLWRPARAMAPLPGGEVELAWVRVQGVLAEKRSDDVIRALAEITHIDSLLKPERPMVERARLFQQVHDHTVGYRIHMAPEHGRNVRSVEVARPIEGPDYLPVAEEEIATRGLAAAREYLEEQATQEVCVMKSMAWMLAAMPRLRG